MGRIINKKRKNYENCKNSNFSVSYKKFTLRKSVQKRVARILGSIPLEYDRAKTSRRKAKNIKSYQ